MMEISLTTMSTLLAFCQRQLPRLGRRNSWLVADRRALGRWLGTAVGEPELHALLAVLGRLELLRVRDGRFVPAWGTADWLALEREAQEPVVQEALADEVGLVQAAERLGLRFVPDVARVAWLRQHYRLLGQGQEAIALELTAQGGTLAPLTAEPWLRFQLLQMGEVDGRGQTWHICPTLVGKLGVVAGVGWLEQAVGRGLTTAEQEIIAQWVARAEAVQWAEMLVLTVRDGGLRQQLAENKLLARKGVRPLGPHTWRVPRHAAKRVGCWLAKQGAPLGEPLPAVEPLTVVGWGWLGVAVLQELAKLMPLPIPIPPAIAGQMGAGLTVAERGRSRFLQGFPRGSQSLFCGRENGRMRAIRG